MRRPLPSFLSKPHLRLLLFGGKGGVGKTSCATATALKLARDSPESEVLLVSTDPAHSLADSLAGTTLPPNLLSTELDAQKCLREFRRQHRAKLEAIADRGTFLDQEDINRFIDLSLPGLDELMAALEIARWVETRPERRIVVDTAPTGHTLRLLAMPALLRQWLAALNALLAKHRYLKQLYSGSGLPDGTDRFLSEMAASIGGLESLLGDRRHCRFVLVMLAEKLSYRETCSMMEHLTQWKVSVADIVVNRLVPESECPLCLESRRSQASIVNRMMEDPRFSRSLLWGVPLYPDEVRGTGALKRFWNGAARLTKVETPEAPLPARPSPPVQATAKGLPSGRRLLFFAGKGGVGKTTLACATSLRLARESPDLEVLLFSTDPAHSLSTCMETPVGPAPTRIVPGLTALEIDAEAEFHSLKQLYAEELKSFLTAAVPGMDLTFDREAMERLLDLAPPGLDEVMALTRATELLDRGCYQTLVLDAAPTGHLLRLLEMPEVVDRWLKVFFSLFLKYRRVFRLPRLSQRLVEISKNLKRWRSLLLDPEQSALHAVTILTDMAFEETQDLLGACERMRIHVPALLLNLATPASACPLCTALHRREAIVQQKFESAFPELPQIVVYRQAEPVGLPALETLAQALASAQCVKSHE
ncbi:MAG: ArsA family ATPase [Actinomycetota bacterium]